MKVIELKIEEQGFRVLDPEEFFGQNIDDDKTHDPFFGSFTIIWRFFLHQGRFRACELVWDLALKIAYEWEDKHGKRIHKGTPYYFWGVTCILNGDLEKGFLLMHQALEEDKKTFDVDSPTTPAYAFVTLDYEKQDQFFRHKVEEIKDYRATFCQLAIDKGADLQAVSKMMGHNTTVTTETYYGRIQDDTAIQEIERAFTEPMLVINKSTQ